MTACGTFVLYLIKHMWSLATTYKLGQTRICFRHFQSRETLYDVSAALTVCPYNDSTRMYAHSSEQPNYSQSSTCQRRGAVFWGHVTSTSPCTRRYSRWPYDGVSPERAVYDAQSTNPGEKPGAIQQPLATELTWKTGTTALLFCWRQRPLPYIIVCSCTIRSDHNITSLAEALPSRTSTPRRHYPRLPSVLNVPLDA